MLEAFPYPWSERWAQKLHNTLTQLFPSRQTIIAVGERAGIDMTTIYVDQAISSVWWSLLDQAGRTGQTRAVVTSARDLLQLSDPRRQFLDDLLNGQPIKTDGEPKAAGGEPRFIFANDDILEPEALLYHDDLTIGIGRVPGLINTLQRLVGLAPAVCKLTIALPGLVQEGTAFRIGRDLLLTNWHVVHNERTGQRATTVTAEFEYEDDGRGGILESTNIRCDAASVAGDRENDWAVVRTTDLLNDAWPVIKLSDAVIPTVQSEAYIIQHPDGGRKRLGFVRNQVSFFNDRVVHYLTDTESGSSGSPVFDAAGDVIALHHAGGRPQDVLGKPPLAKNEGIRIPQVTTGLASLGIRSW